jgi:hypothetical protein
LAAILGQLFQLFDATCKNLLLARVESFVGHPGADLVPYESLFLTYDSVEDVKVAILGAWTRITLYLLQKQVNSLNSSLISVLERQGCHIDKF